MIPNGWLWLGGMVAVGLVPLLAWFVYMLRLIYSDLEDVRANVSPIIQCVSCDKMYDRAWGSMCPGCSGAD